MKGYAMLKIGESGWIEKDRPECGPLDAICKPFAVAICTSDVHTRLVRRNQNAKHSRNLHI